MSLKEDEDNQIAFTILNELEYVEERDSIKLSQLFDSLFATFLEENEAKDIKVEIEPNYNGLKFGEKFEEGDFKQMLRDFRSNRQIHAKYAIKIFEEAIRLLSSLPNICEFNLKEETSDECIVVGDLHGHFEDLVSIMNRFNIPGKYYYFVFNGDWVDRGQKQLEVILTILYAFILYPKKIFLNRGNHEDRAQNSQPNYKPCLKIATLKYFGKYGSVVYHKLDELFKYLPFATIINNTANNHRYFVVHGGINDKINLKKLSKLDRTQFGSICRPPNLKKDSLEFKHLKDVIDLLWSDPNKQDGVEFNKSRNIGKLFGSDVTKKFLEENDFTLIIRSHECKPKGHDILHDGKVITVFSASNYHLGNSGSILKVSTKRTKIDLLTYNSKDLNSEMKNIKEDNLTFSIKKLRSRLYLSKEKILKDFADLDSMNTGFIQIDELIKVLSNYLPNIPYESIKDRLCECDDATNTAKYNSLFNSIQTSSKYSSIPDPIADNFNMLVTVFHLIDSDNNGYISPDEFREACNSVFNYLGLNFSEEEILQFIEFMDKNQDGKIDLDEFSKAFIVACSN